MGAPPSAPPALEANEVPARLSDVKRAASAFGISLEEPRKGGSHWKAVGSAGTYPLPCHNGLKTELDDKPIKGLCRFFGIDVKEFLSKI